MHNGQIMVRFQSPLGDFGFLKRFLIQVGNSRRQEVSIPSRGFWFFEQMPREDLGAGVCSFVSIPSRGFWFFEVNNSGIFRSQLCD